MNQIVETNRGDLYVVGSHLINETIIAIFKIIIEIAAPTNGVRKLGINTLVFRNDNYPLGTSGITTWAFHPDSGSAVCSLPNCVESAFNIVRTEPHMATTSIKAIIWDNIIQGFAHELYHAWTYMTKREELEYSAKAREKDEKEAEITAHNVVQLMCQTYNMEPVFPEGVADLMEKLWAAEKKEATTLQTKGIAAKSWFLSQKYLRDNNLMYSNNGKSLVTYRDNRRRCRTLNPDLWDNVVKAIPNRVIKNDKNMSTVGEAAVGKHKANFPKEVQVKTIASTETAHVTEAVVEQVVVYTPPVNKPEPEPVFSASEDDGLFYQPGEYIVTESNISDFDYPEDCVVDFDDPSNYFVDDPNAVEQIMEGPKEEIEETPIPVTGRANRYTPRMYAAYKPTGLTTGETSLIMRSVYMKIYNHLVNTCSWGHDGVFKSPLKVFNPIELSEEEKRVVKAFSSIVHGRFQEQITVGSWILGLNISTDGKSIGYKLHIALPDGTHAVRHIFTPKPEGLNAGSQEIRVGNKLVWIVDPNKPAIQGEPSITTRIYNGQFQTLKDSVWANR